MTHEFQDSILEKGERPSSRVCVLAGRRDGATALTYKFAEELPNTLAIVRRRRRKEPDLAEGSKVCEVRKLNSLRGHKFDRVVIDDADLVPKHKIEPTVHPLFDTTHAGLILLATGSITPDTYIGQALKHGRFDVYSSPSLSMRVFYS